METHSAYTVKDAGTGRQLLKQSSFATTFCGNVLEYKEDSWFCVKNHDICCDCQCWCCDINPIKRPLTLTLSEDEGSPMVLEMSRPMGCCLQSIVVRDQTHPLGSVNQVRKNVQRLWSQLNTLFLQVVGNLCGKFEVRDAEDDVQFVIQAPRLITTCGWTQV